MKTDRFDGKEPDGKGPLLLAPPARLAYGRFAKAVVAARLVAKQAKEPNHLPSLEVLAKVL